VKQYDVYLINLDPTVGSEIRKVRPCLVISPDEMNQSLRTVQIAPMTSNTRMYPWRVAICFQHKKGTIAVDQLRTIDKQRMIKRLGVLPDDAIKNFKQVLQTMLID
jgi:mRNA interferase MazF